MKARAALLALPLTSLIPQSSASPDSPFAGAQRIAEHSVRRDIGREHWEDIRAQVAADRYGISPSSGVRRKVASNPRHGWHLVFEPARLTVSPARGVGNQPKAAGDAWSLSLRTAHIGREQGPRHSVAPVTPRAEGNRVEYVHGSAGVTEWYVNGRDGVEHGYTLARGPEGAGRVLVDIEATGLELRQQDGEVSFGTGDGARLTYGKLIVADATGTQLPAALTVIDGSVMRIAFDDHGATYPVTVDPFLQAAKLLPREDEFNAGQQHYFGVSVALADDEATLLVGDPLALGYGAAYVYVSNGAGGWDLQQRLVAGDAAWDSWFGISVALSGDTALVGAYAADPETGVDAGAAYVFTRSAGTWTQQAKLVASDAAPDDYFGYAVALYGDTALVGAYGHDNPAPDVGAAYLFTRSGNAWSQQAKLVAPDGLAEDRFGHAVALSSDTALIGAYGNDHLLPPKENAGAAYVFTRGAVGWAQQAKLVAADAQAYDWFGYDVALSGDTALVGASNAAPAGVVGAGAAYVFVRGGNVWSQQARLLASDAAESDWFGQSVALSGDTALVGAWGDDHGEDASAGSAHLFTRSGGSWSRQAKLVATDTGQGDRFGYAVSLAGNTAVAGAPFQEQATIYGSVYLFRRSGSAWSEQNKLSVTDGAADDWFGSAVAVSGDTLLVAARGERPQSAYLYVRSSGTWSEQIKLALGTRASFGYGVAVSGDSAFVGVPYATDDGSGVVYVLERLSGTWNLRATLTAPDPAAFDYFGCSVAMSGDTAVVGACGTSVTAPAAYVFTRSGGVWNWEATLAAADTVPGEHFGFSVALSGDAAVVGAPGEGDHGDQAGATYVFIRSGGTWSQQAKLFGSDTSGGEFFGYSVALSGDTALVGAPYEDHGGAGGPVTSANIGAAYVFTRARGTSTWTQRAKLTVPDGAAGDLFGFSVALSGETALVGANRADAAGGAVDAGSAYVFTRSGDVWSQRSKLTAADTTPYAQFGAAVALSDGTAVVGAFTEDNEMGFEAGAAYVFELPLDFGDAPDPYPTLRLHDGARHELGSLSLGSAVDREYDGQPNSGATGDDLVGDDEDGLSFGILTPGESATVTVTATGTGVIDAWLDFNGDGDWADADENILMAEPVAAGGNTLVFPVPANAMGGTTYARFRLSSAGIAAPTGPASDGEVEDEQVTIVRPDTPDPFDFADVSGVARGSLQTSDPVTITGIEAPATVSVAGGSYSIGCDGTFATADGAISNGQSVCVRHVASGSFSSSVTTTLTVGGVSGAFTSTSEVEDIAPDPFVFTDLSGVEPDAIQISGVVTVSGINGDAPIEVIGGMYSINGLPFVQTPGTVQDGATVTVRHVSGGYSTSTHTTLTIGADGVQTGMSDTFTTTTRAADATPEPFSFVDQAAVQVNALITSNAVTISGMEVPVPVSVSGGEYSIGCSGTFTSTAGSIASGQTVCVRHTAAGTHGTATDTTLTVGGIPDTFTSTTAAAPAAPAPGGGGGAPSPWLLGVLAAVATLRHRRSADPGSAATEESRRGIG